jgi:hypothetical protein
VLISLKYIYTRDITAYFPIMELEYVHKKYIDYSNIYGSGEYSKMELEYRIIYRTDTEAIT